MKRTVEEILEMHQKWLAGNGGQRLVWCKLSENERTNLRGADLRGADLYNADLRYADLRYADLINANLRNADLRYADLINANLRNADLYNANLRYVNGLHINCPEAGAFIAFKKLRDGLIAKLEIPEHAKRSSATSRKCRASEVKVLEIFSIDNHEEKHEVGYSQYKSDFKYEVGKSVFPDSFDEDRFNECSSGIHFFITLQEAIDY